MRGDVAQMIDDAIAKFAAEEKAVTPSQRRSVIKFAAERIKFDSTPIKEALKQTYGGFGALGEAIASDRLGMTVVTDWAKWKPGNTAAADVIRADGPLKALVREEPLKSLVKEISKTRIDRIGSKMADGLERGLSSREIARMIEGEVRSSGYALIIAQTEGARAQVEASRASYEEAGVKEFEWSTSDPCVICEDIEIEAAGGVPFGFEFNDGTQYPPAHPNCRCDILPVVDSAFSNEEEQ